MMNSTSQRVPPEYTQKSFLNGIKAARATLAIDDSGLTPKAEFNLHIATGKAKILQLSQLCERAQNTDIRHSKIRSVYWKVFLSYLPMDTSLWPAILKHKREEYDSLCAKYLDSIPTKEDNPSIDVLVDNPLSAATGTTWSAYFQDTQLREMIELDVDRTYAEHSFFTHKLVKRMLTNILFIYAKENRSISYRQGMNELLAIVFLINSVQSTIYYALDPTIDTQSQTNIDPLSTGDNESNSSTAAAVMADDLPSLWDTVQNIQYLAHDTYWMFNEIMHAMGRFFHHSNSDAGPPPIITRCKRVQGQFLRQVDPQLAQHLIHTGIEPQLYGLRWVRLFFSREFHMRDCCVIWDSIFAAYADRRVYEINQLFHKQMEDAAKNNDDPLNGGYSAEDDLSETTHDISELNESNLAQLYHRLDFRFVDYACCAMLLFIRHQLIGRDQQYCLRRIMKYPPIEDVAYILEQAYNVRNLVEKRFRKKSSKKQHSLGQYNLTDRWNSISKTVGRAVTAYAEDVKKMMGNEQTTLHRRLQFEHALGEKMAQILDRLQQATHRRKDVLARLTMQSSTEQTFDNASITTTDTADDISAIAEGTSDKDETERLSPTPIKSALNAAKPKHAASDRRHPASFSANDLLTEEDFDDDPLSAGINRLPHFSSDEKTEPNKFEPARREPPPMSDPISDPIGTIEEALAELKLVKDALLGNLDETMLEAWLDFTPTVESGTEMESRSKSTAMKQSPSVHRKRVSKSGLPPPPNVRRSSVKMSATATLSSAAPTVPTTAINEGGPSIVTIHNASNN